MYELWYRDITGFVNIYQLYGDETYVTERAREKLHGRYDRSRAFRNGNDHVELFYREDKMIGLLYKEKK